jgi:hypothetical protein
MGLTLIALGKNAVEREVCCAAVVLHILVAGNLATSSMISLSQVLCLPFSASARTQMPLFSSGADECYKLFFCLEVGKWEMLPCVYDVLQFYCNIHF